MGIIIFNEKSSLDYQIQVEHPPQYEYPERDYEVIHVPGRNGDFVLDKGSYANVKRSYDVAIAFDDLDYASKINRITEWLHSAKGYARLEDSYEPDYYRMAMYQEGNAFSNVFKKGGRATIQFDCKPQRFLKSGEKVITLTEKRNYIQNYTAFDALPILKIYGSDGTIMVNQSVIAIVRKSRSNGLTIDSDIQDCYEGTKNCNAYVQLTPTTFPTLKPGMNEIVISGGIEKLEVIPRWWTL